MDIAKLIFERIEISIHAAREGGDGGFLSAVAVPCHISIHAAREGGDPSVAMHPSESAMISIHAAREGGDGEPATISRRRHDFNPRRP